MNCTEVIGLGAAGVFLPKGTRRLPFFTTAGLLFEHWRRSLYLEVKAEFKEMHSPIVTYPLFANVIFKLYEFLL